MAVVVDPASAIRPVQPGRNVTTVTTDFGTLNPKRLELFKALAPHSAKIAILTIELPPGWERAEPVVEIEAAARTLGLTLVWIQVAGPGDLEAKLMQAVEQNADAIVKRITPMLKKNDIVTVFSNGGFDGIHEKLLKRLKG